MMWVPGANAPPALFQYAHPIRGVRRVEFTGRLVRQFVDGAVRFHASTLGVVTGNAISVFTYGATRKPG